MNATPVLLSDQDEIALIEQAFAETPRMAGLEGMRVRLDDDPTTDPAVWVYFRFTPPLQSSRAFFEDFARYTVALQQSIWGAGSERVMLARFDRAA